MMCYKLPGAISNLNSFLVLVVMSLCNHLKSVKNRQHYIMFYRVLETFFSKKGD